MVKPLSLRQPVLRRTDGVLLKILKIQIGRIDSAIGILFGKHIHTVPAICRMFCSSAIYHGNEFWQSQEIAIKNNDGTPEIGCHCLQRRFSVSCYAVTDTGLALDAAVTIFPAIILCYNSV